MQGGLEDAAYLRRCRLEDADLVVVPSSIPCSLYSTLATAHYFGLCRRDLHSIDALNCATATLTRLKPTRLELTTLEDEGMRWSSVGNPIMWRLSSLLEADSQLNGCLLSGSRTAGKGTRS